MRRSLAKIPPYPAIGRATTSISAAFSTSSPPGGRGRGRGRGAAPFQFTVDTTESQNDDASPPPPPTPQGHGRGRGNPLPSFPSLQNNPSNNRPPLGRGRGLTTPNNNSSTNNLDQSEPSIKPDPKRNVKMPFLFVNDEEQPQQDSQSESAAAPIKQEKILPNEIVGVLSGAGRGKPATPPVGEKPKSENRHIRQRPHQQQQPQAPRMQAADVADASEGGEKLSQEEKTKKALGILSRRDEGEGGRGRAAFRGGGGRGARGGRGRGGRGGRGRGEVGREGYGDAESDDDFVGDPAEEEKLAQKLGPEIMLKLTEGFEEMSGRVLPSPMDDAYLDALHTNLSIECEPEYLMEEFGTNPDIDEKPPIPLRDALEKMKPFLMAYEGIKSQEEWEGIIEETMKTVPLMKEIVDYYSGPNRVTAKQQQEELERVAKTLPATAPASVKRFTERAVLSLQSNPGWGFDKKCQFMDKLVMEVSKQYK